MSISYEEALATLEAMFSAPWTRETLDLVLRHEKGHMENTCDRILSYGSENDPQGLIQQLQSGQISNTSSSGGGGGEAQSAHSINVDEEIARQLAAQLQGGEGGGGTSRGRGSGGTSGAAAAITPTPPTAATKGRGTPTALPKDFLRIPGYPHRSVLAEAARSGKRSSAAASAIAGASAGDIDDEALARMLQDEFFSQELARNPEFAHLAASRNHRTGRSGAVLPPAQRRSGRENPEPQQPQGPNLMDKISFMGDTARKRLSMFATQFEAQLNQTKNTLQKKGIGGGAGNGMTTNDGMGGSAGMSVAERRGLLDENEDEEDMIEFEMRKNK